jgi:hypothetical protein
MSPRNDEEEIAAALAANFDEDGDDLGLARDEAALTPEQRARSRENLERCMAKAA